jgi:hypothetical protein
VPIPEPFQHPLNMELENSLTKRSTQLSEQSISDLRELGHAYKLCPPQQARPMCPEFYTSDAGGFTKKSV